jgi:hypothetical protein
LICYTSTIETTHAPSRNYGNRQWPYWKKPTRLTTGISWFDRNSKATLEPLLGPTCVNKLENPNMFELLLPPFHFLDPHNTLIAHIELLIAETTPVLNTNAFNVVTQLTSIGIIPFTSVEPAIKLPLDMHPKHVKDRYMMTESADIMTLMDMTMEILWENINFHLLVCTYLFPQSFK